MRLPFPSCLHGFEGVDVSDGWSSWQESSPGAAVQDHYIDWSLNKHPSCCSAVVEHRTVNLPSDGRMGAGEGLSQTLQVLLDKTDRLRRKECLRPSGEKLELTAEENDWASAAGRMWLMELAAREDHIAWLFPQWIFPAADTWTGRYSTLNYPPQQWSTAPGRRKQAIVVTQEPQTCSRFQIWAGGQTFGDANLTD